MLQEKESVMQEEHSGFLLQLRSYLIQHWERFGLPGSPKGLAYRVRQTPLGRAMDRGRLVALWFDNNPEKPLVVTKWTPGKNFSSFILQEHQHARWLYETRKLRFVPKPLDCPEIRGIPVLIEEAILGRSLAHQILSLPFGQPSGEQKIESAFKSILGKASAILEKIQDPLEPVSLKEFLDYFHSYLARAQEVLEWHEEKSEKIAKALRLHGPNPVPGSGKTLLVGDFAPQNLIDAGEKGLFLIDLEFSLESPLAFLDPLAFVFSMFRFLVQDYSKRNHEDSPALFQQKLFNENHFSKTAGEFLVSRSISQKDFLWYWLVFFIHETAFQHFISETFTPELKSLFNTYIGLMINQMEKR